MMIDVREIEASLSQFPLSELIAADNTCIAVSCNIHD
jgi:hypothetical protein